MAVEDKGKMRRMLEKEAAGLEGVTFDDNTSDPLLRQLIATAPVTDRQRMQAAALGIELEAGLNYGSVKNLLGGHTRTVSLKCIKDGGWREGTWLEYDGRLVVITAIDHNKGRVTGRVYDRIKMGPDHLPMLCWEALTFTSNGTTTTSVPASELAGAAVVEPDKLPNILGFDPK